MNDTESMPADQRSDLPSLVRLRSGQIIGAMMMSPMISMVISRCLIVLVNPHFPSFMQYRQHDGPGWVCEWSSLAAIFIIGVVVLLITSISYAFSKQIRPVQFKTLFRAAKREEVKVHPVPRVIRLGRIGALFILLPQLLILAYVVLWSVVESLQSDVNVRGVIPKTLNEMALTFGPAFCLGLGILFVMNVVSFFYALSSAVSRESIVDHATTSSQLVSKFLAMIGVLLILPSLTSIVVLCWIATIGQFFGPNFFRGMGVIATTLLDVVYTMGPANLLGSAIFLWAGSQWLSGWYLSSRSRVYEKREKVTTSNLRHYSKIGAFVGGLLMSPILIITAISCWVAISQLFSNSTQLNGLSCDVMLNLGPYVVAGCVVLPLSIFGWYVAICVNPIRSTKVSGQDLAARNIPRLSKVGACIGCLVISPWLMRIVVVLWNYFYYSLVLSQNPNKAWFDATQILEREFDIVAPIIYGGYLVLIASGLGVGFAYLMRRWDANHVIEVTQPFDDL